MKKSPKKKFIVRWFVSSVGLWLASQLLGSSSINYNNNVWVIIIGGGILALANTFVRPLVVFLTLPAVLLSLGIFMVIINALMVLFAAWVYDPLEVNGFGTAVITGMLIGLVNWLVGILLEEEKK